MSDFLEQFNVPDWLGREVTNDFSIEKIILISIFLLACFIVPIKLKNNMKATRKVLIGLWIFALVLDLIKYTFYNGSCYVNELPLSSYEFPLWTCSIYLFVVPISLFSKNQLIKDSCNAFICTISMLGGFINFIFPTDSLLSFMGLHTFLYHFALLITPIIMLVTGYYKPEFKHFKGACAIFIMYAIPVYVFNAIFKQDYMFIYDGSWFGPLSDLASFIKIKPLWTIICVLGHLIVMTLMVYIESSLTKKQHK